MNNFHFINGVGFKEISNFIIDTDIPDVNLDNIIDKDIVWCKTEFIELLFPYIEKTSKRIILITHCSDHDINEERFSKKPNNIVKWFAQNVNFQHSDLIPLPIGLENHSGPHKGSYIDANYLLKENFINRPIINKIISPIYCNFTFTNTNRIATLNTLKSKQIAHVSNSKPFSEYCEEMKKFMFVASPKGNGIDCHRTWEALYLGCVPIVERHFMYDSYKELPILQIDSWENFNLNDYKHIILEYKEEKLFKNTYMLDKQYFFDKILSERETL
jgi:hypothetical protein